ncbi:senataxin, partial [Lecanoromycetidae sp. Uapishka_2]
MSSHSGREDGTLSYTGRIVAAEALEVASEYIKDVINIPNLPAEDKAQVSCAETCLKIIKHALRLECKSLRTDQGALKHDQELPNGFDSYSPAIWDAVVQHLDRGNVKVARAALVGINDLTGLEKFKINADEMNAKEKSSFNNGLLRTQDISGRDTAKALEKFWRHQWESLGVIYDMTETWSRAKVADTQILKDFCRDTMQLSEHLFDQYSVFASAIDSAVPIKLEEANSNAQENQVGMELVQHPAKIMEAMAKWLRLRDEYLMETSVNLTKKVLGRLTDLGMVVAPGPCRFLELVLTNGPSAKTNISPQEKAEIARALEANLGHPVLPAGDVDQDQSDTPSDWSGKPLIPVKKNNRNGTIDLDTWRSNAKSSPRLVEISDDDFGDSDAERQVLSVSRSAELMKDMEASIAARNKAAQVGKAKASAFPPREQKSVKLPKPVKPSGPSDADRVLFREKREKEREAKKRRDAESIAQFKKKASVGIAGQTLGEGSGLESIGVRGKDHAPKSSSMMVSSGSESESDDDLDHELFGTGPRSSKTSQAYQDLSLAKAMQVKVKGPIKKTRQVRSAKDMRARLAPDLTGLHKTILSWDFFHNGDFPPGSERNDYSLVSNTFRTPNDYENTFEPLLILEAWQGFLKSKEEGGFKVFEVKVANRMTVDAFLELGTTMSMMEGKEQGISEADIVLISKGQSPADDAQQPHCLARVHKISRKKGSMEITYKANAGNSLVASMVPNSTLYAVKISSLTPLEREYGALLGLKYFDLCDEVIRAKPSPLLEYSDKQLAPLVANYRINIAQAKAVRSAIDNDAFTLIQGPPGSGKTKTIVAIVGALLTGQFGEKSIPITRPQANQGNAQRPGSGSAAKKLLVCAPSNAAVDELVMRFKEGIKTVNGNFQKLSVIRLGRSDAINANVRDVTLEELVNAKLNLAVGKKTGEGDEVHKIMMKHKEACDEFNALRTIVDEAKAKGKAVSPEQDRDFEILRRKKQQLSNQIDAAKDVGDTVARDADLRRRHVQQEILNDAHVICATLSGSGHDMFQNLKIEFENVVIDEAAQSIELSALIPLKYGCSKCVLVGDPKQLPPTVLSREAARFQYEQSLFVRMQANHPDDVHLLDTQYRMHPEISLFPSNAFYDSKLLDGAGMAELRRRPWHQSEILGPYRFFDVHGAHQSAPQGHSLVNHAEIEVALSLFDRLITDYKGYDFKGKVGIITPYKSQLRQLRFRFAQKYSEAVLTSVEFNTTDAFQGRESNSQSLMRGDFWGRLIQDAKNRDRYTSDDLIGLLKKPLAQLASSMPSTSKASTLNATSFRNDNDVDMPDAPVAVGVTTTHRPGASLPGPPSPVDTPMMDDAYTVSYNPSGGANGLNPKACCQKCGSYEHYTNLCKETRVQGDCYRCGANGHRKNSCSIKRCITCGEFGHLEQTCTSTTILSSKNKGRIARQEEEHRRELQKLTEGRRKSQLGGHDVQIPVIRSTPESPPHKVDTDDVSRRQQDKTGDKRKRDPSSPTTGAPKEPRLTDGPPRRKKEVDPFIRPKKRP